MVKGNDILTIIGNTDNLKNCQYNYKHTIYHFSTLIYLPGPHQNPRQSDFNEVEDHLIQTTIGLQRS